jgi:membrane-bound lytic murein transglycosylase D
MHQRLSFRCRFAVTFCIGLTARIVFSLVAFSSPAEASPGFASNIAIQAPGEQRVVNSQFAVSPRMRGRVDFWKDIFAKYGRTQVVIHHRDFPQVVFGVMDFSDEALTMSELELSQHRQATEKRTVAAVKTQLAHLAAGKEPETVFQQKVVKAMAFLPGGNMKYQKVLDEDLVRTQTGIRQKFGEAIRRAWRYLPVMEQIFVSEHGLPKELTRLPFIESSFDYTAYSSVGAAGMWQFMPRTARSHGMAVGKFVDERRDPIKATHAAAEYLRSAYNSLGSWPLAVTSYNHGVGGVRSKVNKAGSNDLVDLVESQGERYFGFASSNFYPEFLAANEIFDDHQLYFPEIPAERPLRVVSFPLRTAMSVGYVARQLDMPLDALKEANYALLDPVWNGAARIPAGYLLRVPVEYQGRLDQLVNVEPGARGASTREQSSTIYGGVQYKVRKGDTLASIAKRYGSTPAKIAALNGLSGGGVRVGQLLVVKGKESSRGGQGSTLATEQSQAASVVKSMPQASRSGSKSKKSASQSTERKYTVRRGDTLSSISKKTGRSVAAIKKANRIAGSTLQSGKTLTIP